MDRSEFLKGMVGRLAGIAATGHYLSDPTQMSSLWRESTAGLDQGASENGGIWYVVSVPGSNRALAGLGNKGLWYSDNGGMSWSQLCGEKAFPPHVAQILFDPKDPNRFWTAGIYGAGVFHSRDGGRTTELLSSDYCDTISVDFTDPYRRTLIHGLHERANQLSVSFTSGKSWRPLTEGIPPGVALLGNPLIVGDNAFVVPAAGSSPGMYRTSDAGKSWRKVSDLAATAIHPRGVPLVTSDGAVYWLTGGGLIRSDDTGHSWEAIHSSLRCPPIEVGAGAIASVLGSRVAVSRDKGVTWRPVGPPLPFQPHGIAYSVPSRTVFAWAFGKKKPLQLVRWSGADL